MSKKKNSFLMQGMILAGASIVCRIIGLLYRSPLFGIIGKAGVGYYGVAYNIYNIILLISSFSIPLAVSKSISARLAKREYINAQRIFYGALVYAALHAQQNLPAPVRRQPRDGGTGFRLKGA